MVLSYLAQHPQISRHDLVQMQAHTTGIVFALEVKHLWMLGFESPKALNHHLVQALQGVQGVWATLDHQIQNHGLLPAFPNDYTAEDYGNVMA